jgi:hypothetical protein
MRRSKRPGRSRAGSRIRAVRGAQDDHVGAGLEAVHLGEDLVERLLALVIAATESAHVARARTPDRVQLVDKDDRRGCLLCLLEEVTHPRGAHADDRLDELRGRRREEGRIGLARDRACEQRLPGPGRPVEKHAVRNARPELRVALRVLQEVDDLDELSPASSMPATSSKVIGPARRLDPPCS